MTLWTNAKEKRGSSRILSFLWQGIQDDYRTLIGVEAERNNVKSTLLDKDKKGLYYPVSTLPNREYS